MALTPNITLAVMANRLISTAQLRLWTVFQQFGRRQIWREKSMSARDPSSALTGFLPVAQLDALNAIDAEADMDFDKVDQIMTLYRGDLLGFATALLLHAGWLRQYAPRDDWAAIRLSALDAMNADPSDPAG